MSELPIDFIHCGTVSEFIKSIPDESVDLVLTDPPYGMNYKSREKHIKHATIENDNMNDYFRCLLTDYYKECGRILKVGGAIYSFCSHHHIEFFKKQICDNFTYKKILTWYKNNHTAGDHKTNYAPIQEFIIYATKGEHILRGGFDRDVLAFSKVSRKERKKLNHATPKPIDLLSYLIRKSTDPDDIVFDGFLGSGQTAKAAWLTGRRYVAAELDSDHWMTSMCSVSEAADEEIEALMNETGLTWEQLQDMPEGDNFEVVSIQEVDPMTIPESERDRYFATKKTRIKKQCPCPCHRKRRKT